MDKRTHNAPHTQFGAPPLQGLSGGATFSADADTATLGRSGLYACDDTSAPRTLTISTATITLGTPANPWFFVVKDQSGGANTNNITVASEGAQLFDGAATVVITEDFGVIRLYSDGVALYGW